MARTLAAYRSGLLAYYDVRITSGPMEGTNHEIKTMTRQAYGSRDQESFKLKILAIHETRSELVGQVRNDEASDGARFRRMNLASDGRDFSGGGDCETLLPVVPEDDSDLDLWLYVASQGLRPEDHDGREDVHRDDVGLRHAELLIFVGELVEDCLSTIPGGLVTAQFSHVGSPPIGRCSNKVASRRAPRCDGGTNPSSHPASVPGRSCPSSSPRSIADPDRRGKGREVRRAQYPDEPKILDPMVRGRG